MNVSQSVECAQPASFAGCCLHSASYCETHSDSRPSFDGDGTLYRYCSTVGKPDKMSTLYWQRMYDNLVGLRRLVLLRTYMIVSTFMWSSLYLRDILSQHYRPLHTTMTHAVDMQTKCTLVQCRTPREVRYLNSKLIVFPGQ